MGDENPFQTAGADAQFQEPVLGAFATVYQVAFTAQLDELGRRMRAKGGHGRTRAENGNLQGITSRLW